MILAPLVPERDINVAGNAAAGVEVIAVSGHAPTIAIETVPEAQGGWTLSLDTTNFTFIPASRGRIPLQRVGHGELYVDGERRHRLYGPHHHLTGLEPGPHVITVTLNATNGAAWSLNGEAIVARAVIIER